MADTASLVVRVSSQGVSAVNRELGSLTDSAKSAAAAVGLVVSASAGFNKLVTTARQTDILTASLETLTGSSENASLAFAELQKFAETTPYSLDQAVEGFNKLVSMGLEPSQKALESYGNTAAAMGKDLSMMIEAVADAATGEFERLKEFGIKAKSAGDQVSFTFQGITTTVGKNAAEIEGYLQSLGENQFAGAMANRMATLDGALSNLQDSWDNLFRAISSEGAGDAIEEQVRTATAALDELSAMIASGEMAALISAWGDQWTSTFADIHSGLSQLDDFMTDTMNNWGVTAESTSDFMSDAFWEFPANMRALVQIAVTEVAGFVDKVKVYGEAAAEALNPFSDGAWQAQMQLDLAAIDHNVNTLTASYLAQRDASVAAMDDQIDKSKELRAEFDKQKKPFDLGQFQMGGGGAGGTSGGPSAAQKKSEAAAASKEQADKERAQRYLDGLAQANMSEMELISVHEQEKLARVNEFRAQGLIDEQEYQDAITEIQRTAAQTRADLEYEAAKQIEEANQKLFDAEMRAKDEKEKRDQEVIDKGIEAHREMTSQLKSILGENNDLYKAAALTQIAIDTQRAAIAAYAAGSAVPVAGVVLGPLAAGAAVAYGAAAAAEVVGAREQGGSMTGGSAYQMAERGKAEVIVPAGNSRAKTIDQMNEMMGGKSSSPANIVIVNQTTGRIDSVQQEQTDEEIRIIVREEMVNQTVDQSSPYAKARRSTRDQPGY